LKNLVKFEKFIVFDWFFTIVKIPLTCFLIKICPKSTTLNPAKIAKFAKSQYKKILKISKNKKNFQNNLQKNTKKSEFLQKRLSNGKKFLYNGFIGE